MANSLLIGSPGMLFLNGLKKAKIIIVSFLLVALATEAFAAYSHHTGLAGTGRLDLRELIRSQYASQSNLYYPNITSSILDRVRTDADLRISPEFRVPHELKESVTFWLRVYTEFTTQHLVLFDGRHPEIIYEVLDFRPIAQAAKNRLVYEVIVKNKIKTTLDRYRAAFRALESNPRVKNPNREQKMILAAIRRSTHRHGIAEFRKSLRTQTGQRDNIVKGLAAAEPYFANMEQIFSEMRLPSELIRLSLVESSFDLSVTSRVGAAGVWQFMPESGREYLRIDSRNKIDERLSPLKSTLAAAKLLKRNYFMFRSWPLAITSYNHGYRNLRDPAASLRKDQRFGRIAHLFRGCNGKQANKLGWASQNYYSEFLAALHAERYRHLLYGDFPYPSARPVIFQKMHKSQSGLSFALSIGLSLNEFKFLNPDIRDLNRPLPRGFLVALPADNDDLGRLTKYKVSTVRPR